MFQRYNLLPQLSAASNVEVPAVYANVDPAERRKRAAALLERLGLSDRAAHRPHELSGGQQQRVSIARALMNGGAVILADEPTGALDHANGREVIELLQELNRQGHTIIIATHDLHVASHAPRIIELSDGAIVSDRLSEHAAPILEQGTSTPRAKETGSSWLATFSGLAEAARTAVAALLAHRLRSSLTLLGIIIGIMSVTMMIAIGESYKGASLARTWKSLRFGSAPRLSRIWANRPFHGGHKAFDCGGCSRARAAILYQERRGDELFTWTLALSESHTDWPVFLAFPRIFSTLEIMFLKSARASIARTYARAPLSE